MNGMLWKQEVTGNSTFLLIYYFLWFDKTDLSTFDDEIYHQDNFIESYVWSDVILLVGITLCFLLTWGWLIFWFSFISWI